MSYQIKATPFFQRMLATSKKSGELQKLKEEYERIKDFNEKAIETKMRQVRLKRLFQEIEEIKVANLKRRCLTTPGTTPVTKTNFSSEQRLHNLTKAKEMGQYFSRRNAAAKGKVDSINDLQYYRSKAYLLSKHQLREIELEEAKKLKERMSKRSNYGNDISNWNMHKMLMGKLGNVVTKGMKETANIKSVTKTDLVSGHSSYKAPPCVSDTSLEGKEKLMYRISYGNTISDLNMISMPKRKTRSNMSKECIKPSTNPESVDSATFDTALSDIHMRPEIGNNNDCVHAQNYLVHDNGLLQPLYACDPLAMDKSRKAQERWSKLLISVRYHFASQGQKLALKSLDNSEEDLRYQLRSISNDTNLLQSDVIPEYCEQLELSEKEDDEYLSNEMLLNTERLSDATPSNATRVISAAPKALLPLMAQQRLSLKPITKENVTLNTKDVDVERLMSVYEPFSMQVVEKEIFESGVQKLMQVFEHKNYA